MPTVSKFGKRERPAKNRLSRLLENLRSQMTWLDLIVGLGATSLISFLFLGFRYQVIQDYVPGDVASLAAGLRRWAEDKSRLARAKGAAWVAARRRWHWEHPEERGALLEAVAKVLGR